MRSLWEYYGHTQHTLLLKNIHDLQALITSTLISEESVTDKKKALKQKYTLFQPYMYNGHMTSVALEKQFGTQIMQNKNNIATLYPLVIKTLYNALGNE